MKVESDDKVWQGLWKKQFVCVFRGTDLYVRVASERVCVEELRSCG